MRTLALGLTLALAIAPDARAQAPQAPQGPPEANDETKTSARRSARKGRTAAAEGRWDDAIAHLREAHARWALPHLLLEIARAFDGKGDLRTAWSVAMQAQADAYDDDTRAATAEEIARLRAALGETHGQIHVTAAPAGARLTLTGDAEVIEAVAPLERWLAAGRWTIRAEADGHAPRSDALTLLPGGSVKHSVTLTSLKAIAEAKAKAAEDKRRRAEAEVAAAAAAQRRRLAAEAARREADRVRRQAIVDARTRMAWAVVGAGGAVMAGGLWAKLEARRSEDELDALRGSLRRRGEIDATFDRANASTISAHALLTVGAGIVSGGAWLVWSATEGRSVVAVGPGALAWLGSFP